MNVNIWKDSDRIYTKISILNWADKRFGLNIDIFVEKLAKEKNIYFSWLFLLKKSHIPKR